MATRFMPIFVTGMQRSGTTLLEKLLCNHPRISLLSQPFPLLFVEVKRRFLRLLGEAGARYPLGDLFLEAGYGEEDLHGFLAGLSLGVPDLRVLFEEMADFSGQYTRFAPERYEDALGSLEPGDVASILAQLYRSLAHKSGAGWFGGKETLWEELVPFLLERGFTCLLILRDPRGVLASLNHGRGPEYGGQLKPTLFNVRNWRKSAAFALHLESHARFLWLRYEDLIAWPRESLDRIAAWLGIEPFAEDLFAEGIHGQDGQLWEGNSSHRVQLGIDPSSAGRHRVLLPPEVAHYVEATCWPELRRLGYPVELTWAEVPEVIRGFADSYETTRLELRGYAAGPERAAEELRRWELLRKGKTSETRSFFLFEDVFKRLQEVLPA
jgi:hypothetical protein